jgi:adenylylsulfate kinase
MSNVVWITGLSAAGKTTLAKLLTEKLKKDGRPVIMLDGDILRQAFNSETDHKQNKRKALAYSYSRLTKLIADQDIDVVVSVVALFKEIHEWNRLNIKNYFEVYLKVDMDELRRRDPKKIYSKYYSGEIKNVAGLDLDFDEPKNPDLVIEFNEGLSPKKELKQLLNIMTQRGYL